MAWPTNEEIEEQINDMSTAQLEKLVSNIHTIAKFLVTKELKKLLIRKAANIDQRINVIERQYKLGDFHCVVRKSIIGQDDDPSDDRKWPSIS